MTNDKTITAEIFSAGEWNGDKYTIEDLDSMVMAFNELVSDVKPPLKLGHKGLKGDGQPAIGWVSELTRMGDKLMATFSDVPDIVRTAMEKKLFKRVSSEIYWNLKRKTGKVYSRVLAGVALLGADIPAVTNLADLTTYFSKESGASDSWDMIVECSSEIKPTEIESINNDGGNEMSDDKIKEYADKLAKTEAEKAQLEAQIKEYTDKETQRVKDSAVADFKAYIECKIKEGKLTPAAAEVLTSKHEYTDAGITFTADTVKAFVDTFNKSLDIGEKGAHTEEKKPIADARAEVDRLATEYKAQGKAKTYSEALEAVLKGNPELAKKYAESGKDKED